MVTCMQSVNCAKFTVAHHSDSLCQRHYIVPVLDVVTSRVRRSGRREVNSVSFQIDSKTHKIQQNRTNQNEKTLHINNLATTKSIKTNKRASKTNKSTIHKDVGGPRWGRAPT